jgi:hypothetical protein
MRAGKALSAQTITILTLRKRVFQTSYRLARLTPRPYWQAAKADAYLAENSRERQRRSKSVRREKRAQAIALARDTGLFDAATELLVAADKYDYSYLWSWMGVPIIQMPEDIMRTHREKAARRIVELLGIKSGDRVLDIGCGIADVVQHLPASVDCYGFDVSGDYAAAPRRRCGTRNCFAVEALKPGAAEGIGRRFRTPDEYMAIAHRTSVDAKARVVDDPLSIPYTHFIVVEAMAAE